MVRRICAAAAVFILTLYCFFLYEDEIVAVMLVAELAYYLLAFITLRSMKRNFQISLLQVIPIAEKNQEIPVKIQVRNRSRFLGIHFQVRLRVENSLTGEKEVYQTSGTVGARAQGTMPVRLRAQNCGNIQIMLERYWIYDILSVFKCQVKIREIQRVGVLPECHLLPVEVTRSTREFLADAEEFSDRESGDDPSETYQIREYRETDSIHDIHWKLSAKADELQVKEHGRPLGSTVLIWLNLESDGKRAGRYKKKLQKKEVHQEMFMTNVLEVAASLSLSLLEEKCVHMVAWYEEENQIVRKKRISREEHIYELMNRLLFVKAYQDQIMAKTLYEEIFREMKFSTIVEFRMDGAVLINGEEKMKLPKQSSQVKWEELYFTV